MYSFLISDNETFFHLNAFTKYINLFRHQFYIAQGGSLYVDCSKSGDFAQRGRLYLKNTIMKINFLELLEFIEENNKSDQYSQFLKFVEDVRINPNQDLEISIPQNLINDFIAYKSDIMNNSSKIE